MQLSRAVRKVKDMVEAVCVVICYQYNTLYQICEVAKVFKVMVEVAVLEDRVKFGFWNG